MSAALVVNGADPTYDQGSVGSLISSQVINGVSPGNGNFQTVRGHMFQSTLTGSLLVCEINSLVYANAGGAYVPVLGAPSTPGYTWTLAGVATSATQNLPDGSASGGHAYITSSVAIYYLFLGANGNPSTMSSSVLTTQTTTFSGTWQTGGDENISSGFEITEWSGVSPLDIITVVIDSGISDTPDAGNIVVPNVYDLLFVGSNLTGGTTFYPTPGVGYTGLDDLANVNSGLTDIPVVADIMAQYMLNGFSGSYSTSFTPSDATKVQAWAAVAVSFSQALPTGFPHAFGSLIGF